MNPMYQQIALSFLRYALAAGGLEGLVSDDQLTQAIGAVATVVLVIWSVRKNIKQRQVLVTALSLAKVSENQATLLVKDPMIETPSVTAPKDTVPR